MKIRNTYFLARNLQKISSVFIAIFSLLYLFGESIFSFKSAVPALAEYPDLLKILVEERITVFKNDVSRSLIIITGLSFILYLYLKNKLSNSVSLTILAIIVVSDLWSFNSNYVNKDNFKSKSIVSKPFQATKLDKFILKDTSDFRVFEYTGNNGKTSYFHKSISGYSAVKPKRIQDIFDFYIYKNDTIVSDNRVVVRSIPDFNSKVFDLLNVKYIFLFDEVSGQPIYSRENNTAKGNAWFVEQVKNVKNENEELLQLKEIDYTKVAISKSLENKSYILNQKNSIKLKSREANKLIYNVFSDSNQFAVFSEAFYSPGWSATINSKEYPHYKVNYLLRGMEIPKGKYELTFTFDPPAVKMGSIINIISFIILLVSILFYFRKNLINVSSSSKK